MGTHASTLQKAYMAEATNNPENSWSVWYAEKWNRRDTKELEEKGKTSTR